MAEMHRWIDRQGQAWECDQYDHGPFCRLCRPVGDPVEPALLQLVDEGLMEMSVDQDGNPVFRVTPAGKEAAADLVRQLSAKSRQEG